jgi:hypothetical protein
VILYHKEITANMKNGEKLSKKCHAHLLFGWA